ncbi:hypothetical protein [Nonomuraea soli]|uniref:Uncharacterized protein n=1 Tax=Nonomuraea soli TaxID=1032476 RepID=A0A7W0CSA7_9ACTN|nr:hypothetical protein [Nonomuraea soli]MBA2896413.1 hypothetical protein [Nonomuraea soli]
MTALLAWCLRLVEDFADDIIAAFNEYKFLSTRNQVSRLRTSRPVNPANRRAPTPFRSCCPTFWRTTAPVARHCPAAPPPTAV